MKNLKLLDCTLRDGGRLFDCKFSDYEIAEIARRLAKSNIDIVEVGFLRDPAKVQYSGDSTFFTRVDQITPLLPKNTATEFVAFIDYGMFDFDTLPQCDGSSVTGLRVGFTKKNFDSCMDDVVLKLRDVQSKGYRLYMQGVNSLAYSDEEMIRLIGIVNEVHPNSFGIVDTYGAMYPEDLSRIFGLIDANLSKDIMLDFHGHNNRQMAFALAQDCIRMCGENRTLIIDATLEGMGKCAGNLNLELIVDFLNNKKSYNYDFDEILDMIDEFIRPVKKDHSWGYSVPALMGGLYKSHPNNIIYLFNKFRLGCKDFKNIISMIDPDVRQRYDYDNLERLYCEYSGTKIDDTDSLAQLHALLDGRNVLVKSPGNSIKTHSREIEEYIAEKHPVVITVSFSEKDTYCFCTNKRRYDKLFVEHGANLILTSNVTDDSSKGILVNYNSLIDRRYPQFENSVMMLLNLLRKMRVAEIAIAGFDGYEKGRNNFINNSFHNDRKEQEFELLNSQISTMVKDYISAMEPDVPVKFITPTKYLE